MNNETGKCIQEIESADLKLKLNSNLSGAKGNKKNFETVTVHEHDQDVENSNIGKENIEYLTDNRRQILYSNYSEENYCGNLKEEMMDSKLLTRIKKNRNYDF